MMPIIASSLGFIGMWEALILLAIIGVPIIVGLVIVFVVLSMRKKNDKTRPPMKSRD